MRAKIRDVAVFVVDAYRANWVFAKIYTDCGVTGVGEGTLEFSELAVASTIQGWRSSLIGHDAFRVEFLVEQLHRDSYWRTGMVLRSALSAVEAALLDIKGKMLGVPVYDLLGGAQRQQLRCYLNGWFIGAREPEQFAANAMQAVSRGFGGIKWDPFGTTYLNLDKAQGRNAQKCVEAVRAAVGDDVELMIEMHGRFNVPSAVEAIERLSDAKPYWFEEPVPPESIAALADVRRRVRSPIAAGERLCDLPGFCALLDSDAVDHVQPDVCHVGGLGELKRIAAMAHARFRPVSPHNPMGPVANAMTMHAAAAIPNFGWLETMQTDVPWRAEVAIGERLEVRDGLMLIPDAVGLGIDIDEQACARHPYREYGLRHYKGTLTSIRPADAIPFYEATTTA